MKKYIAEQQIMADFDEMVTVYANGPHHMSSWYIADQMPVKVLRWILEQKGHGTSVKKISKMKKSQWVDAVLEVVAEASVLREKEYARRAKEWEETHEKVVVESRIQDQAQKFALAETKAPRSRYDFSDCKDEEKLRKVLNRATREIVEHIAGTFEQIQLPAPGKRITKKELVNAIVNQYFPKSTSKPVPEVKEEKTMKATKLRLSDVVKALQNAETADAIEAVLKTSTKAVMLGVLFESTNGTMTAKVSTPKAKLAEQIARQIVEYRATSKFRALTLDEKYDYLTSQTDKAEVSEAYSRKTEADRMEIAEFLGIEKDCYVLGKTLMRLLGITDANLVKSLVAAGEVEKLKDALSHAVDDGMRILSEQNGLEVDEYDLDFDSSRKRKKLIDFFVRKMSHSNAPAEVSDAVSEAIRVMNSDASSEDKHDALLKCTDSEMFEVMKACTGGRTKLGTDYDSHEELASKVLERIGEEVRLDVAV